MEGSLSDLAVISRSRASLHHSVGSLDSLDIIVTKRQFQNAQNGHVAGGKTLPPSPLTTAAAPPTAKQSDYKDRGYAWIVMIAGLIGMMCHGGISTTSTLTYQQLRLRFNMSATAAGAVTALHGSIRMFSSPLVSILCHHLSSRTVAMMGGLLYSMGLVLMAWAPSPIMVYAGYGVVSAVGSNMFILCTFVIISQYFYKRRGQAMGVTFCGAGLGTIAFSPLIAYLFDNFGFTYTILMEAGIVLQMCVGAALYRPPPVTPAVDTNIDEKLQEEDKKEEALPAVCTSFLKQLGLNSLRHPTFLYVCILCSSLMGQIFSAYIYTAGLAMEVAGLGDADMATVLSVGGLGELPARLLAGIVLDFNFIRPNRLYVFAGIGIVSGACFLSLQFSVCLISLAVVWALYQAATMALHTQHVVILAETLPPDELAGGIATSRVFQGMGLIVSPTLIGLIQDNVGTYRHGYVLVGGLHALLSAVFIAIAYCFYKKKNEELKHSEALQVDVEESV